MRHWLVAAITWLMGSACADRAGEAAPAMSDSNREMHMNVADEFNRLADEWERHCDRVSFSSKMSSYLEHASYRGIIALGEPAIPLIVERYRRDDLPWGFALQEITGVKMIENPDAFKPKDVKRKWLEWWDERVKTSSAAGSR